MALYSKPHEAHMAPALRHMTPRKMALVALCAAIWLIVCLLPADSPYRTALGAGPRPHQTKIPRIVHLVQLKTHEGAELHFPFQYFLCVYSAYLFVRPSTIYIHTDHDRAAVQRAIDSGSSWTRKVLTSFPGVVLIHEVVAPTAAANGLPLERIEHKSDFVRMEQVARYGGVYLDWDVLTLRSPAPLLDAGFAAVVGRQVDGNINNGCYLARADAALVRLMNEEMPVVFSGEWQQHSTGLITSIAERVAFVPGEVLIMDHKAFAPTSWWDTSAAELFSEHEGDGAAVGLDAQVNVETEDPMERWYNRTRGQEWEMDFSQTYFLHAFKSLWGPPARFDGVSVPYVLRRSSNYALAAWPVVIQGIKDGIIDKTDETL